MIAGNKILITPVKHIQLHTLLYKSLKTADSCLRFLLYICTQIFSPSDSI